MIEWGIVHQDLTNITTIGIDEIQYRQGHKYLTLVYQQYNLRSVKAHLMREDFNRFWTYPSAIKGRPGHGLVSSFLREWCVRANRSKIEPIKKLAKTLLKHESQLLNWFEF